MQKRIRRKENLILLTAVLSPAEEDGYITLNPETGTTSQGETVDEAIANLEETTSLYLEEFPGLSGKEIIRALEKLGFRVARRSGSHVLMKRDEKGCVEPNHKEVKIGSVNGVLRLKSLQRNLKKPCQIDQADFYVTFTAQWTVNEMEALL